MAEGKKNIAQLRAEVRGMMATIQVAPSKMCRADLERMKEVLGAAAEKDKALPIPNKKHGGRTKAKEVEGAEKDGIAVPKKLVKEKTRYAIEKEKKAKSVVKPNAPSKLDSDSNSDSNSDSDSDSDIEVIFQHKSVEKSPAPPKPKRVLTDEHKAKMAAGRAAKKQQASAAPAPAPASASAAPDSEMYVKLPVFRLG